MTSRGERRYTSNAQTILAPSAKVKVAAMDRLDALEALVLSVDQGSLSAAARSLGRSAASVTRALSALERKLERVSSAARRVL